MGQNKRMVTVTVTEDGKEIASLTDRKVFIVSGDKSFTSVSCKLPDLLEFAIRIQSYFIDNLIPALMVGTKPNATEDMLFETIVNIAKSAVAKNSGVMS